MFLEINLCSGAGAPWNVDVTNGVACFHVPWGVNVIPFGGTNANGFGVSGVHSSPQELLAICVTSAASKHVFIADQAVVTYKHSFMEKALKLGSVDYDNLHDEDFNVIFISNEMV